MRVIMDTEEDDWQTVFTDDVPSSCTVSVLSTPAEPTECNGEFTSDESVSSSGMVLRCTEIVSPPNVAVHRQNLLLPAVLTQAQRKGRPKSAFLQSSLPLPAVKPKLDGKGDKRKRVQIVKTARQQSTVHGDAGSEATGDCSRRAKARAKGQRKRLRQKLRLQNGDPKMVGRAAKRKEQQAQRHRQLALEKRDRKMVKAAARRKEQEPQRLLQLALEQHVAAMTPEDAAKWQADRDEIQKLTTEYLRLKSERLNEKYLNREARMAERKRQLEAVPDLPEGSPFLQDVRRTRIVGEMRLRGRLIADSAEFKTTSTGLESLNDDRPPSGDDYSPTEVPLPSSELTVEEKLEWRRKRYRKRYLAKGSEEDASKRRAAVEREHSEASDLLNVSFASTSISDTTEVLPVPLRPRCLTPEGRAASQSDLSNGDDQVIAHCERSRNFDSLGELTDPTNAEVDSTDVRSKQASLVECLLCLKLYPGNSELYRHYVNKHSANRLLSCRYCPETFRFKLNLGGLARGLCCHINECHLTQLQADRDAMPQPRAVCLDEQIATKHQCTVCLQYFDRDAHVIRHGMREHGLERDAFRRAGHQACDLCPRTFRHVYTLACHKRDIHAVPLPADLTGLKGRATREYTCPVCLETLAFGKLRSHIKVNHEVNGKVPCRFCEHLMRYVDLADHFATHHTEADGTLTAHPSCHKQAILCADCGMAFKTSRVLRQHHSKGNCGNPGKRRKQAVSIPLPPREYSGVPRYLRFREQSVQPSSVVGHSDTPSVSRDRCKAPMGRSSGRSPIKTHSLLPDRPESGIISRSTRQRPVFAYRSRVSTSRDAARTSGDEATDFRLRDHSFLSDSDSGDDRSSAACLTAVELEWPRLLDESCRDRLEFDCYQQFQNAKGFSEQSRPSKPGIFSSAIASKQESVVECVLCLQLYPGSNDLYRHYVNKHCVGKSLPCRYCPETFGLKRLLRGSKLAEFLRFHMEKCHGGQFQADRDVIVLQPRAVCYDEHIVTDHQCAVCREYFDTEKARIRHGMREHALTRDELRPPGHLPCDLCPRTFAHVSTLTCHQLDIHQVPMPVGSVTTTGGLQCCVCLRDVGRGDLLNHVKTAHEVDGKVPCRFCREMMRYSDLKNHFERHHTDTDGSLTTAPAAEPPIPCADCGKVFKSQQSLLIHCRDWKCAEPDRRCPSRTKHNPAVSDPPERSEVPWIPDSQFGESSATGQASLEPSVSTVVEMPGLLPNWPVDPAVESGLPFDSAGSSVMASSGQFSVPRTVAEVLPQCDAPEPPAAPSTSGIVDSAELDQYGFPKLEKPPPRPRIKSFCDICQQWFTSRDTLRLHKIRGHGHVPKRTKAWKSDGEKKFACKACGLGFATPTGLLLHEQIHLPVEERCVLCPVCLKVCQRRVGLTLHMKIHTDADGNAVCRFCSAAIPSAELLGHVESQHAGEDQAEKLRRRLDLQTTRLHHCQICKGTFLDKTGLELHMTLRHGVPVEDVRASGLYGCEQCTQRFTSQNALRVHSLIHKDRECPVCLQRFGFGKDNGYAAHLRSHSVGGNFHNKCRLPCRICGDLFDGNQLRRHLARHVPWSSFIHCPLCPEMCEGMDSYARHIEQHKDKFGRLSCRYCEVAMPPDRLLEHLVSDHSAQHKLDMAQREGRHGPDSYRCAQCSEFFTEVEEFQNHVKAAHSEPAKPKIIRKRSKPPTDSGKLLEDMWHLNDFSLLPV